MGVLITPPHSVQVSKELRAILPKYSAVRLVQSTSLSEGGEEIIIYERGNWYEPHSHLAVVKNDKLVIDFSLVKLFGSDIGETFVLFRAAEFGTPDNRKAFVAALRGFGDGSGTIFLVVTERNGGYQVWKRRTTEGLFKVLRTGDVEVWSGGTGPDGGIDCVWCPRYYDVQNFKWVDGAPIKVGQFTTKHILSPYAVADQAILIRR